MFLSYCIGGKDFLHVLKHGDPRVRMFKMGA